MNNLFPEEKIEITFNCTHIKNINGNKKEYHVGVEKGFNKKIQWKYILRI